MHEPMRRIHRLIALLLAALWLPAVAHCGMETLGKVAEERGCCSHESDTSAATADGCVADHCGVFDEGHYKAESGASVVVPMPLLAWSFTLPEIWMDFGPELPARVPDSWATPPEELTRRWMFELRTAPLANAPGLIEG
jgi:hypothetical protein